MAIVICQKEINFKMKIALLLTGFVRHHQQTYKSLLSMFPLNKVDIFIETWDVAYKLNHQKREKWPEFNEVDITKIYKPKNLTIHSIDKWHRRYKSIAPRSTALQKRHYSATAQLFTLKNGLEKIGNDYDVVVRTRFDIRFDKPPLLPFIQKYPKRMTCFSDNHQKLGYIRDYFFASSVKNMQTYLDFKKDYVGLLKLDLTIEAALATYFKQNNMVLQKVPGKFTLIKPPPKSSVHYNFLKKKW